MKISSRTQRMLSIIIILVFTIINNNSMAELVKSDVKFPKSNFSFENGRKNQRTDISSRGGKCQRTTTGELTALVPEKSGLTVSEYPEFWVYIPDKPQNVEYAEFILKNYDKRTELVRNKYLVKNTPAFVGVSNSTGQKTAIQDGIKYSWEFRLVCNHHSAQEVLVTSYIEKEVNYSYPRNKNSYYINGIWYDLLSIVANNLRNDPNNPQFIRDWENSMSSVGVNLGNVLEKSILDKPKFGEVVPVSKK